MTIKSPFFLAAMMFAGLAMSQSAEAREVQLQGHYSQSQVKAACDKAGGQDFEGEGVYGCENPGNGTSVYCDSKKCWGFVPDRLATGGSGTQASQVVKDPLLGVLRAQ